jgi:hypothetical protein
MTTQTGTNYDTILVPTRDKTFMVEYGARDGRESAVQNPVSAAGSAAWREQPPSAASWR